MGHTAYWFLGVCAQALTPALANTAAAMDGSSIEPVRSLLEMRRNGVVMQQWGQSCGAAALATVLTHGLGDTVTETRVIEGLTRLSSPDAVRSGGGFSLLDLKRFAEARGFRAVGYGRLSLDDLTRLRWSIVPMRQAAGERHFVVVVAVDDTDVELADPDFGRHRMSVVDFAARWIDGLALVVSEY